MPKFKRFAAGEAQSVNGPSAAPAAPPAPTGDGGAPMPATTGALDTGEMRPINFDVGKFITTPYQQVGELTQYEHQKQMRQTLDSAVGMSETARNELVKHFVERGLGITPEVDEAISRLANTFIIDWGDENNQKAIFGTMDTLLKNGGPAFAGAGMNLLSDFYKQAKDNPAFDPTEMLQVLNDYQSPGGDPAQKAVRAWSFLTAATTDPSDVLGSMGIGKTGGKGWKTEKMKSGFMMLLTGLAARPDAEQLASGEMAQLYNAHKQSIFDLSKFYIKELMGPVGQGLQHSMALAEGYPGGWIQRGLQPEINWAANTLTTVGTLPAPYAAPFGAMGPLLGPKMNMYPGVTGGTSATSPSGIMQPFENVGGIPKSAGARRKFRRLAQSGVEMQGSEVAQQMDSQVRQNEIMSRLFGGDLKQAIGRINPMLVQQETLLEAKISQYQIFIKQWDEDIQSGTGLADPKFAESMKATSRDMMATYDSLLSVYAQMMELLQKDYEFFSANAGPNSDKAMTDAIAIRNLKTKMDAHLLERNRWWSKIADVFKMRAQMIQVTSVAPLQEAVQALTTAFGGDFGASAALGAAHLQVADQLGRAEKQLEEMGDLSAAKRGHLRKQRLEADTAAVKALMGGPSETGAGPAATSPTVMGI